MKDEEIGADNDSEEEEIEIRTPIHDRHDEWLSAEKIYCNTFTEVIGVCKNWLYLEDRDEVFILVSTAALLDRELEGDPIWLFLITPSGGMKSELIRALSIYEKAYTLDILTPNTFISGLTRKNRDTGEPEPVGGLLFRMDGKCLLLKDFTTILSSDQGTRSEIYGQLRSIYDGYYEKGFGTLPDPIRVKAKIGLVAGVTPIIDKYSKMTGLLGERFLKIRSNPNKRKATRKASDNAGKEVQMRHEISNAFKTFFDTLEFSNVPDMTEDQADALLEIGLYLGYMRAHVWTTWAQGAIIDMDVVSPEVPTRVTKQLRKLARIMTVILGHDTIQDDEMNILRRVARDTANQKRQKIVDVFNEVGLNQELSLTDIAARAPGLHYKTAGNQIIVMEALDIVEISENGLYRLTDSFKPLVKSVSIPTPPINEIKKPENGSFSALTGGEGILSPDDPRYKLHTEMVEVLEEAGGEMDPVFFFNLMWTKNHPMDAIEAAVRTSGLIEISEKKVRLV